MEAIIIWLTKDTKISSQSEVLWETETGLQHGSFSWASPTFSERPFYRANWNICFCSLDIFLVSKREALLHSFSEPSIYGNAKEHLESYQKKGLQRNFLSRKAAGCNFTFQNGFHDSGYVVLLINVTGLRSGFITEALSRCMMKDGWSDNITNGIHTLSSLWKVVNSLGCHKLAGLQLWQHSQVKT